MFLGLRTKSIIEKIVPVSDFNKGKAGRIFSRLEDDDEIFVVKNNRPAAVVVSVKRWKAISDALEKLEEAALEALARKRLKNLSPDALISDEEVMRQLGITPEDIENAEEPEIG